LPFETLAKPKTTTNEEFKQWQQNQKDFEILRKYFNNLKR
jgi:hypothetical protein